MRLAIATGSAILDLKLRLLDGFKPVQICKTFMPTLFIEYAKIVRLAIANTYPLPSDDFDYVPPFIAKRVSDHIPW